MDIKSFNPSFGSVHITYKYEVDHCLYDPNLNKLEVYADHYKYKLDPDGKGDIYYFGEKVGESSTAKEISQKDSRLSYKEEKMACARAISEVTPEPAPKKGFWAKLFHKKSLKEEFFNRQNNIVNYFTWKDNK